MPSFKISLNGFTKSMHLNGLVCWNDQRLDYRELPIQSWNGTSLADADNTQFCFYPNYICIFRPT